MRLLIAFAVLLLPLAEIAGFVVVGRAIGVLPTLALVIAAAVLGVIVLRSAGLSAAQRIRREMDAGGSPGPELAHGALKFMAGVLLLIPGFLTDIAALALLVPAVRSAICRRVGEKAAFTTFTFRPGSGATGGRRSATIDLDEEDFSRSDASRGPSPDSPWRRIEGD